MKQLVELQRNLEKFDERGASLIAVSADPVEKATKLVEDEGITFPVAADPELSVIDAYGMRHNGKEIAVPAVFVLDRNGHPVLGLISVSITDRPEVERILEAVPAPGS